MQNNSDNAALSPPGKKLPLPVPAAAFLVSLLITGITCAVTLLGVFDERSVIRIGGYEGFFIALLQVILGGLSGSAAAALHSRSSAAPVLCRSVAGLLAALVFFDQLFLQYAVLNVSPQNPLARFTLSLVYLSPVSCGILAWCVFFYQYFQNSEEVRAVFTPSVRPNHAPNQPHPAIILLRLAAGGLSLSTLFSAAPAVLSWKVTGLPWQSVFLFGVTAFITAGFSLYVIYQSFQCGPGARRRITIALFAWPLLLFIIRLAEQMPGLSSTDLFPITVVNLLPLSPAPLASLALAWYFAQSKDMARLFSSAQEGSGRSNTDKEPA